MVCKQIKKEEILQPELFEDTELANLTKALGNIARVRILKMLLQRDSCVCGEIVENLPLSQATVSQHLKVLKEAGLIQDTTKGQNVFYSVNPAVLKRFKLLIVGL